MKSHNKFIFVTTRIVLWSILVVITSQNITTTYGIIRQNLFYRKFVYQNSKDSTNNEENDNFVANWKDCPEYIPPDNPSMSTFEVINAEDIRFYRPTYKIKDDGENASKPTLFVSRSFNNRPGSCIYVKENESYRPIYGSPNWRLPTLKALIDDKYLIVTYGCGTECTTIDIIDISINHTVSLPMIFSYYYFTPDYELLITCTRELPLYMVNAIKEIQHNDKAYMCEAFNLYNILDSNTAETYWFAERPMEIEDYQLDIDGKCHDSKDLFDFNEHYISICFIDKTNNIEFERVFDIKDNFAEVEQYIDIYSLKIIKATKLMKRWHKLLNWI